MVVDVLKKLFPKSIIRVYGEGSIITVHVVGDDNRQYVIAERTYRDGYVVKVDPTQDELSRLESDEWAIWNSREGALE